MSVEEKWNYFVDVELNELKLSFPGAADIFPIKENSGCLTVVDNWMMWLELICNVAVVSVVNSEHSSNSKNTLINPKLCL